MRVPIIVGGAVAVGFVAGAVLSHRYWGYPFHRPQVDARVASSAKVLARSGVVVSFTGSSAESCRLELVSPPSAQDAIRLGASDPYYGLAGRFLIPLSRVESNIDALPQVQMSAGEQQALCRSATDAQPQRMTGPIMGEVLELDGRDSRPLLFLSASDRDPHHKTYLEVTLVRNGAEWDPLSHVTFAYDVATWEGFEWPVLHLGLAVASGTLAGLAGLLVVAARWAAKRFSGSRAVIQP